MTLTASTFGVWILAGFIFGFLDPVIVSYLFDVPMENLVLCLRRFFGITILGGGVTCIVQFFVLESVWRESLPLFFLDGKLNRTAIQSVENNNLDTRVPILSNDELGEVAEGVNRMIDSLREGRRTQEAFGRYMGNEIRDAVLSGDVSLEGEMKLATLLFCDLRNFTGMVESTHPRQVVQVLNQHFLPG